MTLINVTRTMPWSLMKLFLLRVKTRPLQFEMFYPATKCSGILHLYQWHVSKRNIIVSITKLENRLDRDHCHDTTEFQEGISILRGETRSFKFEGFSSSASYWSGKRCIMMAVWVFAGSRCYLPVFTSKCMLIGWPHGLAGRIRRFLWRVRGGVSTHILGESRSIFAIG